MPVKRVVKTVSRVQGAPKRKQQRRTIVTTTRRWRWTPRRRFYYRRSLPAARTQSTRSYFNMRTRGATTYVTGHDIIDLKVDTPRTPGTKGIFWSVPVNPAYWIGTRIAGVISSYSNYRPVRLSLRYQPSVGTTVSGNVTVGTIFHKVVSPGTIVQTLNTSNGGFTTQCYNTHSTRFSLGSELPQNLYYVTGSPDDPDVNPFTIAAYTDANSTGNPGYFVLSYTYKLSNPGVAAIYDTSPVEKITITKAAGEAETDYTIQGLADKADAAVTIMQDIEIDGVKYGSGTTFQIGKIGLIFSGSMAMTFKALYNLFTATRAFLGIIYSYVSKSG